MHGLLRARVVFLFTIAALLCPPSIRAQSEVESIRATIETILEARDHDSHAWEVISHLTDEIGPRLSGTRQAELAVSWTTATLEQWGFPTRNQPILVPQWIRGVERASLVSHHDHTIVLTALGDSVATPPEGLTADLVVVRSFDELRSLGRAVEGKIVLFNSPMSRDLVLARDGFTAYAAAVRYRGGGASAAAAQGAVAALVRSATTESMRTPHTGQLCYAAGHPAIPAAAITTEDADLLQRLSERGEPLRINLVLTPRWDHDVPSANVIAELRGRDRPEEIVLIGAHLDSWDLGTGAIDNAAGVTAVMEAVRLLRQLGLTPRRTIRVVLFMNEENGLRGSFYYFFGHRHEKHVAAIESDAGAGRPLGFFTTLGAEGRGRLNEYLAPLASFGPFELMPRALTGADTGILVRNGVIGFGVRQDPLHYFDHHHAPSDTLDKVDPEALRMNAAVIAALAWTLAEIEDLP
ncbi:MAG TPA: M20/M25/M40 family metallo-hydrolase [Thermoanaerobaculia bacterium]|nr:M20/M25/M40 family metallo-hydrolase [Thermoanaerobaculia bacterium]